MPGLLLLFLSGCVGGSLAMETGPPRPLDAYALGANGNLTGFDRPWDQAELLDAFQRVGVRHIRYPAGTLGNYWDWDEGWIDQSIPDSLMIRWVTENRLRESSFRYPLENLAKLTRATGAVPVFVLNMLSKDLDHSLRNLRRAADLGIPVRYIEMGNELYFNIPYPLQRYPQPEDYARTCERWITVLRAEFPEARFAIVGSHLEVHARQKDWTKRILALCPSADAVTYHAYNPSGLDGRMTGRNLMPGEEGIGNPHTATRTAPDDIKARQRWEREQLRDPAAYTNLLTTAETGAREWHAAGIPAGMEIWATEFNMRDDRSIVRGSWAQALLLSVYYGEFYRAPVRLMTIHNFVGDLFGLVYTNTTETDYLIDRPRAVVPYALTAAGVVTNIFAQATGAATGCTLLNYPDAPLLEDDRKQAFSSVRGLHFTGAVERGLLINYGLEAVTVDVPPTLAVALAYTYCAPLDRTIMGWNDVDTTTTYISGGKITLPPTSITQLTANP